MKFSTLVDAGKRAFEAGEVEVANAVQAECEGYIELFAKQGMFNEAISAEIYTFNGLIKPRETEELAGRFWKKIAGFYPDGKNPSRGENICFIFGNGGILGHTEALAAVLTYTNEHPYIASLGDVRQEFRDLFKGFEIIDAHAHGKGHADRLLWLKEEFKRLRVGHAVWVSSLPIAHYAFKQRLAECQTFWAMRYHGYFGPGERITCMVGSGQEATYHGAKWKGFSLPLPPKQVFPDRDRIRAGWNGHFTYGTISREEKIAEPEFLKTLVGVIKGRPEAHLIWTGRNAPPQVLRAFNDARINDRCHFVGWIQPGVASTFDAYLETFPLGGITSLQAVHHRVPVVVANGSYSPLGIRNLGVEKEDYIETALDSDSLDDLVQRQQEFLRSANSEARENVAEFFDSL